MHSTEYEDRANRTDWRTLALGRTYCKEIGYRERQRRERRKIGPSQCVFVKVLLFTAHFDQKPI